MPVLNGLINAETTATQRRMRNGPDAGAGPAWGVCATHGMLTE